MSKRKYSKYKLLRRYHQDFYSEIYRSGFRKIWSEQSQTFKVFLKNIKKVETRIKKRIDIKIKRKTSKKSHMPRPFMYRVDLIELLPKKQKRSLHTSRLRIRHKIKSFFFSNEI